MKKHLMLAVLGVLLIAVILPGANVSKVINSVLAHRTPYQCPLTLQFTADITTEGPSLVKFRWVRSDGLRSPVILLRFARAETKSVNYAWVLPVYNPVPALQWTKVEIMSPNPLLSNLAGSSVHCRPR